jgi:hypothetical protein
LAERERQESASRKRLADEQKKKDAELAASAAKAKAQDEAKAAQLRAACALIYKSTADRKSLTLPFGKSNRFGRVKPWIYTPHDKGPTGREQQNRIYRLIKAARCL